MPRAGTARRRRERKGIAPVKPGVPSWVHGSKLVLFEGMRDEYLAAAEIKNTGTFYTGAANTFVGIYGYNLAWTEDLEEGQTVADDVDPDEDVDELPQEEAERRAEFFKTLRKVSQRVALVSPKLIERRTRKLGCGLTAPTGGQSRRRPKKSLFAQSSTNRNWTPRSR